MKHLKITLSPSGPLTEGGAFPLSWHLELHPWWCFPRSRVDDGRLLPGAHTEPLCDYQTLPGSKGVFSAVLLFPLWMKLGPLLTKLCCLKDISLTYLWRYSVKQKQINSISKWRNFEFEFCWCYSWITEICSLCFGREQRDLGASCSTTMFIIC